MKKLIVAVSLLAALALQAAQPTQEFPLWPDGAPGALGNEPHDIPTLTPFWPDPAKATGAAVVVCPGGGYRGLAGYEGKDYAMWLAEQGIAGFVLKYRLGSKGYRHPVMLWDVSRAIRTVRANSEAWGLDAGRIGVMGSSAGGHLASTVMTHYDAGDAKSSDPIERVSSRPDLGILCYPVISLKEFGHVGSKKALLGDNPSEELVLNLSNDLQVTKDTPPCFMVHTIADTVVPVENVLLFASALRKAGVPFDLHIYENGPHGIALGNKTYDRSKFHVWTRDCSFWLGERKFLSKNP